MVIYIMKVLVKVLVSCRIAQDLLSPLTATPFCINPECTNQKDVVRRTSQAHHRNGDDDDD